MSVRVALKLGPVTKALRFPYADVTITARRLRTPEWDSARDAAQAILRNDADLLNLLVKHDLLPKGGVRGWKRMKDNDPVAYAQYLIGIGMWLTAVECALVGVAALASVHRVVARRQGQAPAVHG